MDDSPEPMPTSVYIISILVLVGISALAVVSFIRGVRFVRHGAKTASFFSASLDLVCGCFFLSLGALLAYYSIASVITIAASGLRLFLDPFVSFH